MVLRCVVECGGEPDEKWVSDTYINLLHDPQLPPAPLRAIVHLSAEIARQKVHATLEELVEVINRSVYLQEDGTFAFNARNIDKSY
jgi:hypothetical protein